MEAAQPDDRTRPQARQASPRSPLNVRARAALAAAVAGAVLGLSMVARPADDGFVWCMFRRVTSLPCPSCGMTRAFCALGHGELERAAEYNLAAPLVYAVTCFVLALALVELAAGRALLAPLWRRVRKAAFAVAVLALALAWIVGLATRAAG